MSESLTFLGLPFSSESPVELTEELTSIGTKQKAEIEQLGIGVTRIHAVGPGTPLRFYIRFPVGIPQFQMRAKLEALLYDVGQKLGDKELSFYATKRIQQTGGWEV